MRAHIVMVRMSEVQKIIKRTRARIVEMFQAATSPEEKIRK
tara:strand:- start:4917 stop:5039 length:123 start_codon:yes stop_codon:yes gene_type:complete